MTTARCMVALLLSRVVVVRSSPLSKREKRKSETFMDKVSYKTRKNADMHTHPHTRTHTNE